MYKSSQKSKNRNVLNRMHKDIEKARQAFPARKMWLCHTSFNKKQMGKTGCQKERKDIQHVIIMRFE